MVWFWKKKTTKKDPPSESQEKSAFLKAVHFHTVDRRMYTRIKYPTVGALGGLPAIECQGHFLDPVNLSLGGLLLLNPPFNKAQAGDHFEIKLSFKKKSLILAHEAQLCRIHKGRWHFKFTKTDRRFFAEFPRLFRSGIKGTQTVEFSQSQLPPGEHIIEFWISESADFLMIQKIPSEKSETMTLCLDGCRARYFPDRGLVVGSTNQSGVMEFNQPVSLEMAAEFLIFLTNFKKPSPRVNHLISDLIDRYYRASARTA